MLRRFWRHKTFTIIHLLGLVLGVCSCLVIGTIVHYEFSFDGFHPAGQRVYQVNMFVRDGGNGSVSTVPCALPPMADALRAEVPGLERVAPYYIYNVGKVQTGKQTWPAPALPALVTTPAYFDVLNYEWLAGDKVGAGSAPFTVVLTERAARRYFGGLAPAQVIGRDIVYDDSLHVHVAGIVKDWEEHTDFPYQEFISLPTALHSGLKDELGMEHWKLYPPASKLWLKLAKDADPSRVQAAISTVFNKQWRNKALTGVAIERLSDLHFAAWQQRPGLSMAHLPTLYALMLIAGLIFLLAIINYVNLATAQAMSREKETAIRKIMGSSRARLMLRFIGETFWLVLAAVCLGGLLVRPVLRIFNDFIPTDMTFQPFTPPALLFLLGVIAVTTVLAGLYPARVLSAGSPTVSLRGGATTTGGGKWFLRKGLITVQFTIALLFITSTLVIGGQIRYMQTRDLGFRADAIIAFSTDDRDLNRVKLLTDNIRKLPGVAGAARQNYFPMGEDHGYFTIQFPERGGDEIGVFAIKADEHYLPLYGIRLVAGRNLLPSDTLKELVVNESLTRQLGFARPEQALGKRIFTWNKLVPIVGIVADFHQGSFKEAIGPMVITSANGRDIAVRMNLTYRSADEAKAILSRIERSWKEVYPHAPFEFTWLDESIAALYRKERTTAWLMKIATGISIFISCLGLLGLTLFTIGKRTREIGIRKVLGAGVADIVLLMSKDLLSLVGLAFVIATPVAWALMHRWLSDFAYRISPGLLLFAEAGAMAVLIVALTVGFQTIRAALADPVKSLRVE